MQLLGRTIELSRRNVIIAGVLLVLAIILLSFALSDDTAGPEEGTGFLGGLFGGEEVPAVGDPSQEITAPNTGNEGLQGRLFKLSTEPVAGATLVPGTANVKYFKRSTGHLFQNDYQGKTEERISNITIPAIMEAEWSPDKRYAVLSYYDDGELKRFYTHYTSTTTAESGYLPRDITSLAMSPAESRIAYLVPVNGQYSLITASPTNTNQKNIFTSAIPDFEVSWQDKATLSLATRGSAYAPSFLYRLSAGGGVLQKVLGNAEGLSSRWDTSGKRLLYAQDGNLNILYLSDMSIKNLGFLTLPEKCAWSRKNEQVLFCGVPQQMPAVHLPDDWWQGTVSFTDALWSINLETGEKRELLPVHQLDAVNLFTSEDETYLFFTNKKDGLLWSLRIL